MLQTRRHKTKHPRWRISPQRRAELQAERDARRLAMPAPMLPSDYPPGARIGRILIETPGDTVELPLLAPWPTTRGRRPRVDSYGVEVDGKRRVVGLTEAADIARGMVARAPSLRMLAVMGG